MKLLLTAFEPFGGETINPAQEAVKLLPEQLGSVTIVKCDVPTVFGKSVEIVTDAIALHRPDAVLCIGQAGGRGSLTPERVAINLDDASIPDNAGNQPVDRIICSNGPSAYFSTLPVKAMVSAIRDAGLPANISYTAGTYVCNHLMYGVLYTINKSYPNIKGGFMHVPFITEQVMNKKNMPSLTLDQIVTGIEAAIKAIAENSEDINTIGCITH